MGQNNDDEVRCHFDAEAVISELAALQDIGGDSMPTKTVECQSCGCDCSEGADESLCHGCGLFVCQSCTDVFGHLEDGMHGKGDPSEEVKTLRAEIAALKPWVDDLQSGMFINCVYCGHRYGPNDETPVSMADTLKAHVEQCPKHPMSELRAKLTALEAALEEVISSDQELTEARMIAAELDWMEKEKIVLLYEPVDERWMCLGPASKAKTAYPEAATLRNAIHLAFNAWAKRQ